MFPKYFTGDGVLNDIKRILGYWKPNTQQKLHHSQLHSMKSAEQEVCPRMRRAYLGQHHTTYELSTARYMALLQDHTSISFTVKCSYLT